MMKDGIKNKDTIAGKDWFTIGNVAQLDSPALLFYPERIAENIQKLLKSIDHISRLRPHVKTHKSADVTLMLIEAGISKFKCATIAEAEMLGACKAADVLLAYQPVGPKIQRFIKLIKTFPATQFSCLADNHTSRIELAAAAMEAGITIQVYLDLNVGMNRTGIQPDAAALKLCQAISQTDGLQMMGLHAYDGHIHGADIKERAQQWQAVWTAILWLKQQILDMRLPGSKLAVPVIIAGGTPTYPFTPLGSR